MDAPGSHKGSPRALCTMLSLLTLLASSAVHGQGPPSLQVIEATCDGMEVDLAREFVVKFNFVATAPSGMNAWAVSTTRNGAQRFLHGSTFLSPTGSLPKSQAIVQSDSVGTVAPTGITIRLTDAFDRAAVASLSLSCVPADLSRIELSCQRSLGKAAGKFAADKLSCVGKCELLAYAHRVPTSACLPPYGADTRDCIDRARSTALKGVTNRCAGICPSCYSGGDCPAHVNDVFGSVDDLADETTANLLCGTVSVIAPPDHLCYRSVMKAASKLITSQESCLDADAKDPLDSDTTGCSTQAQSKARSDIRRRCPSAPACLAPRLDGFATSVAAMVNGVDPRIFCRD